MSEKPDATKIEAALKRAAHKALHGTREERSGRFLLKTLRDAPPKRGDRPAASVASVGWVERSKTHLSRGGKKG